MVKRTLRIDLDNEVWERLYAYHSFPIIAEKGQRIEVRVISQFGEESTIVKVMP
jgi:adenine-specific DNA-methyltransferase